MAKTDGNQSIPSALLDLYRATLGEEKPDNTTGKRYPFRMPRMQDGRGNTTAGQREQRARFKTAMADFKKVAPAVRARWYAARPPWSSFLWYYNYFIMSSLVGNADNEHGGFGVIKSIQFKQISMPSGTGEGSVAITAVDPAKSVVMLYGNSYTFREEEAWALSVPVYPYISSLAAELVKAKWALTSVAGNDTAAATIGITVIEYI